MYHDDTCAELQLVSLGRSIFGVLRRIRRIISSFTSVHSVIMTSQMTTPEVIRWRAPEPLCRLRRYRAELDRSGSPS